MSVILDALRTRKEEEKKGGAPLPSLSSGEGLFLGKQAFLKEEPTKSKKRIWFLAGGLFLTVVFSLTLLYLKKSPVPENVPIAETPTPATVPPPASAKISEIPEGDIARARELFQSGDFDASLKLFQRALEQTPNDPFLHNDLGLVYLKKELYSSAEEHFKKSLELRHDCAECFNNLGYLKTLLGQNVEAEKYLQKASALNAIYPDPWFNLGVLYEKNGDIGQAVKAFRKFLELKPQVESEVLAQLKLHLKELTGQ